tara:strand:+ start:200 stop:400 length:201 start_codon:yes stop_codon:yes gene_type:complete
MSNFFGAIAGAAFFLVPAAALITHVVFCIKAAAYTGSAIALLIAGLFVFPVGIVHGVSLWLGFTWI